MAKAKSAAKSPELKAQPHGGALLAGGLPGNKGGTGRPPNVFKTFLARLRQDPDFQDALEKAAKDPTGRGFGAALKVVTDYDDDKPAEKKQIGGAIELRVKIEREGRRIS